MQSEQQGLGQTAVTFLQSDLPCAHPLSSLVTGGRHGDRILFQTRSGEVRICSAQEEIVAPPHDCVLIDPGQSHRIECAKPTSAVALTLPRHWLRRWLPRPEHCPTYFADKGWSRALCVVMGTLTPRSMRQLALPGSTVAENIGALLALAAGPDSQGAPASAFDSVMTALHASLHLPDLSPSVMADRLHMSTRTLHYAFATHQTTFMKELLRMRLERSAELLRNPHLSNLPVVVVAERCGFTDPSYFARRFRAHFGSTPSDFRSEASAPAHNAAVHTHALLTAPSSLHPSVPR
ncbi:MAG TPA: AraC family transcriptional regulator [Steroidobacteraceae bacterium]